METAGPAQQPQHGVSPPLGGADLLTTLTTAKRHETEMHGPPGAWRRFPPGGPAAVLPRHGRG